jgi:hypothetical protein
MATPRKPREFPSPDPLSSPVVEVGNINTPDELSSSLPRLVDLFTYGASGLSMCLLLVCASLITVRLLTT